MTPRRLGLAIAAAVFVLDQALKAWILFVFRLPERPPVRVWPFFDLVMVWNRGISYGLFQQDGDLGRYGLVALSIVAAVGLGVWLWRSQTILVAVALGLLIGGALGNAVDRTLYGAVADFVLLYWIPFFPYVFNLADSAIVAGVGLLLYDSVFVDGRRRASDGVDPADPDRSPAG
ncbi:MAG: signal peptidase II [Burkholderiales bacterium]|jgi:signal peptidase II|nr:signal peptidase II [Burkholderiales bacterium]